MKYEDPDKEIERLRELLRFNQTYARKHKARADGCQAYAEQMRRLSADLAGMLTESRRAERSAMASCQEAYRVRDAALRMLDRDDIETDIRIYDEVSEAINSLNWEWVDQASDNAPNELIQAVTDRLRPAFAKLTEERDIALGKRDEVRRPPGLDALLDYVAERMGKGEESK